MLCILVAYEMWSQPKVRLHDGEGELNKGGKFLKKVWCCVGGEYYKIVRKMRLYTHEVINN